MSICKYFFQGVYNEFKTYYAFFSGKGCPYDIVWKKSFHSCLKKGDVHLVKYYVFDAARLSIFENIESWYDTKRIHSSIGYLILQKCEDLTREIE